MADIRFSKEELDAMSGKGSDQGSFIDKAVNAVSPKKETPSSGISFSPEELASMQAPSSPSVLDYARDIPVALAKGAIGLGESVVGLGDLASGGAVGRGLETLGYNPKATNQALDELYSDETKRQLANVASQQGFADTVGELATSPRAIVAKTAESVPLMLGGGALGAAARHVPVLSKASGLALGAIGEGTVGAGSAAEQIRQEKPDDTAAMYLAVPSGALTGAISAGVGSAAKTTLGGKVLGKEDIDTMIVDALSKTGAKGAAEITGEAAVKSASLPARIAQGFAREGLAEELPQSVQEQIFQNIATGKDPYEGVAKAAGEGLVLGGLMGGVAGFHGGKSQDQARAENIAAGRDIFSKGVEIPPQLASNADVMAGYESAKKEAYLASPEGVAETEVKRVEMEAKKAESEAKDEENRQKAYDTAFAKISGTPLITQDAKKSALATIANDPDLSRYYDEIEASLSAIPRTVLSMQSVVKNGLDRTVDFASVSGLSEEKQVEASSKFEEAKRIKSEIDRIVSEGGKAADLVKDFKAANSFDIPVEGTGVSRRFNFFQESKVEGVVKEAESKFNAFKKEVAKTEERIGAKVPDNISNEKELTAFEKSVSKANGKAEIERVSLESVMAEARSRGIEIPVDVSGKGSQVAGRFLKGEKERLAEESRAVTRSEANAVALAKNDRNAQAKENVADTNAKAKVASSEVAGKAKVASAEVAAGAKVSAVQRTTSSKEKVAETAAQAKRDVADIAGQAKITSAEVASEAKVAVEKEKTKRESIKDLARKNSAMLKAGNAMKKAIERNPSATKAEVMASVKPIVQKMVKDEETRSEIYREVGGKIEDIRVSTSSSMVPVVRHFNPKKVSQTSEAEEKGFAFSETERYVPGRNQTNKDFGKPRLLSKGIYADERVSSVRAEHVMEYLKSFPVLEKYADKVVMAKNYKDWLSVQSQDMIESMEELYGKDAKVYGMFDPSNRSIVLFSDSFTGTPSENRAVAGEIMFHEALHSGIRKTLNAKDEAEFNKMLEDLYRRSPEVRILVTKAFKQGRFSLNAPLSLRVEESLAMASEFENIGLVNNFSAVEKIFLAVRAFFKKVWNRIGSAAGAKMISDLSPKQLVNLLTLSRFNGFEAFAGPGIYVGDGDSVLRLPMLKQGVIDMLNEVRKDPTGVSKDVLNSIRANHNIGETRGIFGFVNSFLEMFQTGSYKAEKDYLAAQARGERSTLMDLDDALNREQTDKNIQFQANIDPVASLFKISEHGYGAFSKGAAQASMEVGKVFNAQNIDNIRDASQYLFEGPKKTRNFIVEDMVSKGFTKERAESAADAYERISESVNNSALAVSLSGVRKMYQAIGLAARKGLDAKHRDGLDEFIKNSGADNVDGLKVGLDFLLKQVKNDGDRNSMRKMLNKAVESHKQTEKLAESMVFMPRKVKGKFVASVFETAADGSYSVVERRGFDSKIEFEKFKRTLGDGKYSDEKFFIRESSQSELENSYFGGVSSEINEKHVNSTISRDDVPAINIVKEIFSDVVSAGEYLRNSALRQDIPTGYDTDVPAIVQILVASSAKSSARNNAFGSKILAVLNTSESKGIMRDKMISTLQYLDGDKDKAGKIRGFFFHMFIGGNISSALLQMTQGPMMTWPAVNSYAESIGKTFSLADMVSLTIRVMTGRLTADEKAYIDHMRKNGDLETAEVVEGMQSALSENPRMNAFLRLWGLPFQTAEMANRVSAALAVYHLDKDSMDVTDAASVSASSARARKLITKTQGMFAAHERPEIARGTLGAIAMTFKIYPIIWLQLMSSLPPKQKAQMIIMLAIMSGAAGMPFEDDVLDLMQLAAEAMGKEFNPKKDMDAILREAFGEKGGRFVKGGISGMFDEGVSFQSRMSMGNLIPGTKLITPSNKNAFKEFTDIFGVGGSFAYSTVESLRGVANASSAGDVYDSLLKIAPGAAKNVAKGVEIGVRESLRDSSGKKIMNLSSGESIVTGTLKAIGFQPAAIQRIRDEEEFINVDKAQIDLKKARFTKEMAKAIADKDIKAQNEVRDAVVEHNRENLRNGLAINLNNIYQNAVKQARMREIPELERKYREASKEMKPRWRDLINETKRQD